MLADDEHARYLHGGLGVVALLEAAAHFHDPALGIGEVVLVFVAGVFFGRLGRLAIVCFFSAVALSPTGC